MSAAQEIENIQEKMNWHWRNSMRVVRFFAFDARASFIGALLLFRLTSWRLWLLFIGNLVLFRYLENKGLTVPAALRNFRAWLVGAERPGWGSTRRRKFVDYG
ncbi:MAG: type IV secretion protein IcmT [Rhodospirillales bacterium]|nr:type IV secretion protein IcmT [Rhodospirillales bacterium]